MLTAERLCYYLIRLIHAPVHVYDGGGTRTAVYVDYGEQQDILECDKDYARRLLSGGEKESPRLYIEAEQLVWGVAGDGERRYIMGPCCLIQDTVRAAKEAAERHGLDRSRPWRVNHVPLMRFCECLRMLSECLTGESVSLAELFRNSFCDERFEREMRKKITDVFYDLCDSGTVHNPYSQELLEQESIRNGDMDALKRSFAIPYVGELGTLSRDTLRNAKNMDIVLITLASRSAIAGGLPPEVAFSMSDAFIQRAEELNNEGEVLALGRQAEMEYCKAVHEFSGGKRQNPAVIRCKELIVRRMRTKISVSDLAARLRLNPGYLSQLFMKEEGLSLSDYITREKVRFAKEQLLYTDHSCGQIAAALGFSSHSHFGQVFKKWTGMTPGEFRTGVPQGPVKS